MSYDATLRIRRFFSRFAGPVDNFGEQALFYGESMRYIPNALTRYRKETIRLIAEMTMGTGALVLIGGTVGVAAFLTLASGGVIAVQGYESLGNIGIEALTGFLSAFLNVRIVAPVVAGIALAAFLGLTGFALDTAIYQTLKTSLRERLQSYVYAYLATSDVSREKRWLPPDVGPDSRFDRPDGALLASVVGPVKTDIFFEALKIHSQHHEADRQRDGTCQSRPGNAHRMTGAPPRNQHRRQNGVQDDRQHLHDHRRLDDSGAAKRRAHGHDGELQRQIRQEPIKIFNARRRGGRTRAERAHIVRPGQVTERERNHRGESSERQALIEHQIRIRSILASGGMRNQRYGADTENLGRRHDNEHRIAGCADSGDRGIAQTRDKIQVDEKVQSLKEHPSGDGHRHLQDVFSYGTGRQVFHGSLPHPTRTLSQMLR